jgi:hypothetical protein
VQAAFKFRLGLLNPDFSDDVKVARVAPASHLTKLAFVE